MRLIEVLVEGIPSTKGVLRYPVQAGFNPWQQKGSFPLRHLVDVISDLFYPTLRQDIPLGPGKSKRVGMTFEARDCVYRLIRDYPQKKLFLSQLQKGTKDQFRELSSEPRFITETLLRSAKVPSRKVFHNFLVFSSVLGEPENSKDPLATIPKDEDQVSRLKGLQDEKENIEKITRLEEELNSLQNELFETEEKLRKLEGPREKLKQAQKDYRPYLKYDREGFLTPEVVAQMKNFPRLEEKYRDTLEDFEARIVAKKDEIQMIPDRPFWQEPTSAIGVTVALVGFVGTSLQRDWMVVWLPVCILGLLAIVGGVWVGLKRLEKLSEARKKMKEIDEERADFEKRHEVESASFQNVCEEVGVSDFEELEAVLESREIYKKNLEDATREWKEVSTEVPEKSLQERKAQIEDQVQGIESRLADIPPVSMDPNSIDREISQIQMLLRADQGQVGLDEETTPTSSEIQTLLFCLSQTLNMTPGLLLRRVKAGMVANLMTITGKKILDAQIQGDQIKGFVRSDRTVVPWEGLEGQTQREVRFAIHFTYWQMLASQNEFPLILDMIQEERESSFSRMILSAARHLAKKSQVLLLCS